MPSLHAVIDYHFISLFHGLVKSKGLNLLGKYDLFPGALEKKLTWMKRQSKWSSDLYVKFMGNKTLPN